MDDLLSRVERPSRYLGNEPGAIRKDPAQVSFTVALSYPDLYEIGMSNTGLHILYYLLNQEPEVAAERVYLPERDLEALLRDSGRPLCTLENRVPLDRVDLLGIQLPHELAYANIVKLIRLARIPLWATERSDDDPIVVGGGPGAFGCEPVAPFYDVVVLGDGEEAFPALIRAVRAARAEGLPRRELLLRLAALEGCYVPRFYEPVYDERGLLQETRPTVPGVPPVVRKALVEDLEGAFYPDRAIVPYAYTVHSRVGVEVMRGCTVGCRFCQAGMIYRPLRERSPKRILDLARCGLAATGFDEVSLLSLDTGDYTLIDPLTKELLDQTADQRVGLSLPSLRAGSLTDDVIRDIRRVRRTSFTIAPEAGTQRLRDVINKNISDEEIFETVERIAQNGWTQLKLYFMVGFPTETRADLDGLIDLVLRCRELGRRHVRRFNCQASLGTLVPKPWTPFQWDRQLSEAEARERLSYVAHGLRSRGVGCKYHDPKASWLEGVLTRADRRLAPVIAAVEARGGGFESWQGRLRVDLWREVFAEHGIDAEDFLRARAPEETLPWDHLSPRVTKKYLLGDRRKVDRLANPTTFDCRDDLCSGCAVCFEGDVRNRLAKYGEDPLGNGKRLPLALTSRVALGHGVARQLEKQLAGEAPVRDQAAKAGADALAAKLRRRRPKKPGKRRWAVTPGAPGREGPAPAFLPERVAAEDEAASAGEAAPSAPGSAATPAPD
ncbi:MAG: TIGR03960 family B12-binding radical SAM protein, partial [Planctomycetota bacterium]